MQDEELLHYEQYRLMDDERGELHEELREVDAEVEEICRELTEEDEELPETDVVQHHDIEEHDEHEYADIDEGDDEGLRELDEQVLMGDEMEHHEHDKMGSLLLTADEDEEENISQVEPVVRELHD